MEKNQHEAGKKTEHLRVAGYLRVGRAEQLSPEAQQNYFNVQLEIGREGEKQDADSGS